MSKILTAAALTLALVAPAIAQDKPAAQTTGQPATMTTPAITPKTDTKTVPTQVKGEAKLININTATTQNWKACRRIMPRRSSPAAPIRLSTSS